MTQPDKNDILVQQHDGCDKCNVAVRSQPGHDVELFNRHTGRTMLLLQVVSGEGCWLADALARAAEHARGA